MQQVVTDTPAVLTNVTEGTNYILQYPTGYVLHVQVASSAPTDASGTFDVHSPGLLVVRKDAGEEVYVWSDDPGGTVRYEEAI